MYVWVCVCVCLYVYISKKKHSVAGLYVNISVTQSVPAFVRLATVPACVRTCAFVRVCVRTQSSALSALIMDLLRPAMGLMITVADRWAGQYNDWRSARGARHLRHSITNAALLIESSGTCSGGRGGRLRKQGAERRPVSPLAAL